MTTFTTPTRHTDRVAGLHYAEAPVRQRAVLTCGSWRRVTRCIVCGLTCALTVSSLLMPSISFAAEWVEVDGNTYTAGATAGDGSTWAWDGADDMTLNGYNGGGIAAGGKLNVNYEGTNTVANDEGDGISVIDGANESAELNISGTGTLTATAEGDALYSQGDMTISGTGDVNATGDVNGIYTKGDLSINTSGTVTAKGARAEGILADGDITIAGGGTVDTRSEQDFGIVAEETLTVSNSTLTAQGFGSGIYAFDGLTIDAATVRAYAYPAREGNPAAILTTRVTSPLKTVHLSTPMPKAKTPQESTRTITTPADLAGASSSATRPSRPLPTTSTTMEATSPYRPSPMATLS